MWAQYILLVPAQHIADNCQYPCQGVRFTVNVTNRIDIDGNNKRITYAWRCKWQTLPECHNDFFLTLLWKP